MSTPTTTTGTTHEFVGDPRDMCTACGFSVYHGNHNTKMKGKSEECASGQHGLCVGKACTCPHHRAHQTPSDAAIHRAAPDYVVNVASGRISVWKPAVSSGTPAEPPADLTLEEAAKRDNYCPRCRMISFNPNPVSAFCACGDEAWADCCADQECSSCKMPFQVSAPDTPAAPEATGERKLCAKCSSLAGLPVSHEGRQLVHSSFEMFLTRIAKYNDPRNEEWDWDDVTDKWERHAFAAFRDLLDARAEVVKLREALRGLVCPRCSRQIDSPPAPEIMECPHCAAARRCFGR